MVWGSGSELGQTKREEGGGRDERPKCVSRGALSSALVGPEHGAGEAGGWKVGVACRM